MELLKELLIFLFPILTILPLLVLVTIIMGRRSIAELPVFDFLIIISLGAIVGADLADPSIAHLHTVVAVILVGAFQILVADWKISI